MEQLIFKQTYKKIEPFILLLNGLLLAAAISIVHIVGMHAYHLFEAASSNVPLITLAFGMCCTFKCRNLADFSFYTSYI